MSLIFWSNVNIRNGHIKTILAFAVKLLKYKDIFATESGEKLITMVAIDIAFRRMKDTDLSGTSRISGKLLELTELIENTINK